MQEKAVVVEEQVCEKYKKHESKKELAVWYLHAKKVFDAAEEAPTPDVLYKFIRKTSDILTIK